MPFPPSVRKEVLVKSHRRCCVCHDFGGRSLNVHHIIQEADGGPNTLENAICLCLRCHAEAGHFNSRHPLGTKYSPEELRAHRDQWWDHCLQHPDEPFGLSLGVSFKKQGLKSSQEIHCYRLIVTYTNKKRIKKGDRLLFHIFRRGLIYQTHLFKKSSLLFMLSN